MRPNTRHHFVLGAMCLGTFMAILDSSVVNLGLHAIQAAFRADVASLQWTVDIYNLVYAAAILSGGALGDRLGRRRLFVAGVVFFGAGSTVCAAAGNLATLVVGRGVAGLGAALLVPTSLAILNLTFVGPARARAIAVWASANGLAMAVGPTVGGLLVSWLGWRSLFGSIVPVAVACGALGAVGVEESRGTGKERLDWPGQALAATAIVALCLALIEGSRWGWTSTAERGACGVFVVGVAGFLLRERTASSPMVPLALFRSAPFTAAVGCAALMTFGFYAFLFAFPLYLQARGMTAFQAGVVLLPLSLGFFFVSSLVTGPLVKRFGPRVLVSTGMLSVAAGLAVLAQISSASGRVLAPALLCIGVGFGLITGPISGVAVASAPPQRSGSASGLVNLGRMVGATVSVALLALWFGGRELPRDPRAFANGLRVTLYVAALVEALGAIVALRFVRRESLGILVPKTGHLLRYRNPSERQFRAV